MNRAQIWLLSLLLFLAGSADAALYRSVDENGNVVYSDVPPDDAAEPVELPPINVMDAVRTSPPATDQPQSVLPVSYTISIVQPQAEQTFRNTREFPVSVSLQPALQSGHQVAISVDGVIKARGNELSTVVTGIDRGEHRVTASVVDSSGKPIITSAAVVVYVHQRSLFQ